MPLWFITLMTPKTTTANKLSNKDTSLTVMLSPPSGGTTCRQSWPIPVITHMKGYVNTYFAFSDKIFMSRHLTFPSSRLIIGQERRLLPVTIAVVPKNQICLKETPLLLRIGKGGYFLPLWVITFMTPKTTTANKLSNKNTSLSNWGPRTIEKSCGERRSDASA